jgi:hypothetical protein
MKGLHPEVPIINWRQPSAELQVHFEEVLERRRVDFDVVYGYTGLYVLYVHTKSRWLTERRTETRAIRRNDMLVVWLIGWLMD